MKRLNPNNCSVVIFHNQGEELQETLELLHKVFSDVIVKSRQDEVLAELDAQQAKDKRSTLLLIDAESCRMPSPDDCPDLLLTVVRLLMQDAIRNVVPIVCSSLDSPSFMIKCLEQGAADFVLKPLSQDVIKTLFLNVTRYQVKRIKEDSSAVETNKGQIWSKFKDRLKGVFLKEDRLSKLVADFYTPKPSVRRSSMASMLSDRKEYLKSQICSWDFLPLELDDKDLIQVVYMILDQVLCTFDQLDSLRVPSGDLYHFIFDICNSYHSANPYHNFRHAVDVLQANYYFLCQIGALEPMCPEMGGKKEKVEHPLVQLLEPLDIFALLMASIGHDVGHPGVNNNFMVNTSTPLAILYNDRSVLESFHAMSFFHLLQQHCFSSLTDIRANPEYAIFRKIVVNSILATDMSMHDEYVQNIQEQAQRFKRQGIDLSDKAACEKDKILLCGALIKCADISNCARPFPLAKAWAKILAEEFFEQGDLEKELGMTVLPIHQRGKICLEDFQITFKKFVALKLFEAVSQVTSQMQFTVDAIYDNINRWEIMKTERSSPLNHIQPAPDGTPARPRPGI
ncbi:uncharacterized protein EV154DRAFT_495633 [Mucor mucedo]|uniref:uncharacterized protein n=1 Tax=Mucor mucedo TaxID=29922 RepID=UPI0022212074|nr:uncharacterized protein EV154DRAFT_495633 [Mucor mucedo]KAI7895327.1 hypothetical protein EV154DRAFT_495633 [Mucor mucedo]